MTTHAWMDRDIFMYEVSLVVSTVPFIDDENLCDFIQSRIFLPKASQRIKWTCATHGDLWKGSCLLKCCVQVTTALLFQAGSCASSWYDDAHGLENLSEKIRVCCKYLIRRPHFGRLNLSLTRVSFTLCMPLCATSTHISPTCGLSIYRPRPSRPLVLYDWWRQCPMPHSPESLHYTL